MILNLSNTLFRPYFPVLKQTYLRWIALMWYCKAAESAAFLLEDTSRTNLFLFDLSCLLAASSASCLCQSSLLLAPIATCVV